MNNRKFDSVMGIGTDIIEIKRIKNAFEKHGQRFLERIFTHDEQNYCFSFKNPFPYLAARFAAKEAVTKSIGTGINKIISWKDIEITKDISGKPIVKPSSGVIKHYGTIRFLLSISHCDTHATATAIFMSAIF
ncbi:MAG: holo-ACP synthase [Victivallaceae bacterium]